jgi:radical SAM protein with 4Fe4S-binding SPASM domain
MSAHARDELRRAGVEPPRTLTLQVTNRCNLECAHCMVDSGPRALDGEVPVAMVRAIVRELAELGGDAIWLTGGEPLRHPGWRELLRACCDEPAMSVVGVQTNGVLLRDGEVAALRDLGHDGLRVQVSLDGASARTHDRVRGRGTFSRALDGLTRLSAAGLGPQVTIAFTEMSHNMEDLPALLELVDALGLRGLVAGTLVRHGRGAAGSESELGPPTPQQYRALLGRYAADPRFRALCDARGRIAALEWWKGRDGAGAVPGEECCRLAEHPYLTADGILYPSALHRADAYAVGDALAKGLAAALLEALPRWAELVELSRRRAGALPACQDCDGIVHCAGGCLGRALAAFGDPWAVEDRCDLRQAVYRWPDPWQGS